MLSGVWSASFAAAVVVLIQVPRPSELVELLGRRSRFRSSPQGTEAPCGPAP
jgi:hypothetical protein